jgi:hypothetical protein
MRIKTYAEKLRDPRWQRKRLEIMSRDDFKCQRCQTKTNTLNVHHRAYLKNRDPWDYQDHMLTTLCQPCHERTEANLRLVLDQIASNEVLLNWVELFSIEENERAIECATSWIRSLMAFRSEINAVTLRGVDAASQDFIEIINATSARADQMMESKEDQP